MSQVIAKNMEMLSTEARVEPWYSVFGGRYTGDQPFFYDRALLPWTKLLEDNWQTMRDELMGLTKAEPERLKPYFINKTMSFPPKKWKTMGLYFWKIRNGHNCKKCPQTIKILKQLPGCTSASLSILEPGSNINPHHGDTDAVIRCHIGFSIPAPVPDCGFQVGTEIRSWENGITLPFCDAHTHTAWNHSQERRYVMILDVMRPEFANRTNSVCAHVLASSVLQMLYGSFPSLMKKSGYVKKAIYHIARIPLLAFIALQRK